MSRILYIGWWILGIFILSNPSIANSPSMINVNKEPGIYRSPNYKCEASLRISNMGGFLILSVYQRDDKIEKNIIDDVTGMTWISQNELVYTVSPIYGKPGIFIFDCNFNQIKRILGPKTVSKAYPDGADFFELQGFRDGTIYFYYTSDVDSADFRRFRTDAFLYEVSLDGTGLRKVTEDTR